MSGGERGRRNTGYWAPFNIWWRAHLEKHGERPKAEDLKRWFREESRHAFPHEPPTYTMIRNHAKGLRDIASVKHYFRDYRARKRRAVADLAGDPSPRSEPEEEEDNSGGTGSPSDEVTSDEDWQRDSKKPRQSRERRKKRTQQDGAKPQVGQASASGSVAGSLVQQHQQHQAIACSGRQDAEAVLEEQGDLTVTVTVTHSKRDATRCGTRVDSTHTRPIPAGGIRTSSQKQQQQQQQPMLQHSQQQQRQHQVQQQLQVQQHQQRDMDSMGGYAMVRHLPNTLAGATGSDVPQQDGPATFWVASGGWRSAHMATALGADPTAAGRGGAAAGFDDRVVSLGAGRHESAGSGLHTNLPQGQQQLQYQQQQLPQRHKQQQQQGSPQHQKQQQQQQQYTQNYQQEQQLQQQRPLNGMLAPASEPPLRSSSQTLHRDSHAAYVAMLKQGSECAAPAATAGGQEISCDGQFVSSFHGQRGVTAPATAGLHSSAGEVWSPAVTHKGAAPAAAAGGHAAPGTHLSRVPSQPVLPGDAGSTGSTDVHRGGRPVADMSVTGILNPEGGRGRGSCGGAVAVGSATLGSAPKAVAEPTCIKGEELYAGLHGPVGSLERTEGGVPYGLSLRVASASTPGSQPQPWTPFAIPMSSVTEPTVVAAGAAAATMDGGGNAQETPSPLSSHSLRHPEDRVSSLPAVTSDGVVAAGNAGAGAAGSHGLLRKVHGSAPVPGDTAGLQRASWLHRSQQHQGSRQGIGAGGSRGTESMEPSGGSNSCLGQLPGGSQVAPHPPLSMAPSLAGGGNISPDRQMPLSSSLPSADLRGAQSGGAQGDAVMQQQQLLLLQAPSAMLVTGPPPVTTGFAPSKSTLRSAAVVSPTSGGAGGTVSLQASSPVSGQLPVSLAGHMVLTGTGSSSAAAAAHPATSNDAGSPSGGGAAATAAAMAVAASGSAAPSAMAAAAASGAAAAAPDVNGCSAGTQRSVMAPSATSRNTVQYPSSAWPGDSSPAGSWSLAPLRTKPLPAVPFPGSFPPASPVGGTASPLSPTNSGGPPPGIASGSPSRGRWMPYLPAAHPRAAIPPPWYPPYPYPAVPGPRPSAYPAQYVPYGRPLVRRRYLSAPSNTLPPPLPPLPPLPHQHQNFQPGQSVTQLAPPLPPHHHQQQQPPSGHIPRPGVLSMMPGPMGTAWPQDGRSLTLVHGGRTPASGMPNPDPWVVARYGDARPPVLSSTGSAPVPPIGGVAESQGILSSTITSMMAPGPPGFGYHVQADMAVPDERGQVMSSTLALSGGGAIAGIAMASDSAGEDAMLLDSLWESFETVEDDSVQLFSPPGVTDGDDGGRTSGKGAKGAESACAHLGPEHYYGMGGYWMPDARESQF
ncbi:hypothetical protein Vafri_16372 [Volvox africanus]|uniref:Uncharacterized protein n=1 Tax=Volvox africanus TaxID=51714 RepID=A0A8J4BN76_9CHLO|nr:hypothetical protein Vafri_16372 [Volvox africanus]